MKLSSENVSQVFTDCLFNKGEDTVGYIKAEGITATFGFHPTRLENHKQDITDMLNDLPNEFKEGHGKGSSFVNACNDKYGEQWTGLHEVMEQLFVLGIAIGKVTCLLPKEKWYTLPYKLPYYCIMN